MRLVIFDMDGTLIDSEALIVDTVGAAFREVGETVPDVQAIRAISGITAHDAIAILAPHADRSRLDELVRGFNQHYVSAAGAAREPMFAGALEALDRLQADPETILAVATGKGYTGAVTLLERHGIIGRFNSIETPTHNRGKPDPHPGEAARPERHRDPAGAAALGKLGDHRHQLLGMAPPEHAAFAGHEVAAFEQGDRTGLGGAIDGERTHCAED